MADGLLVLWPKNPQKELAELYLHIQITEFIGYILSHMVSQV